MSKIRVVRHPLPIVIAVRIKRNPYCGAHPTLISWRVLAVAVTITEQLRRLAPSSLFGNVNHGILTEVLLKRKKVKANFGRETEGRDI